MHLMQLFVRKENMHKWCLSKEHNDHNDFWDLKKKPT